MKYLTPDAYYVSVLDIDPKALVEKGYRAVLLDLDNTILPREALNLPDDIADWVSQLKSAGLGVALISNTAHNRAYSAADELDVPLIIYAHKPLRRGFVQACAALGVACRDAVMIGDQSYTDIAGARLVGMDAIMVIPQNSHDPFINHLLRVVDHIAVRDMRACGGKA